MPRITDYDTLVECILKFENCVKANDAQLGFYASTISFSDPGSWLREQEYYKREVYTKTTTSMNCMSWNEEEIGFGRIAKAVQEAVNCTGNDNNLIDRFQKTHFNNQFNKQPDYQVLDKAFYDLYRGSDDKKAFDELTGIFGRKYDIIAFLFFIKNPECYLPIHSRNFDEGFSRLGIDYKTERRCSWDNYIGYVGVIREIQQAINELLPMESPASLLDAHSFVWIVRNDYYKWMPDNKTDDRIRSRKPVATEHLREKALSYGSTSPEHRDAKASTYVRDPHVVELARNRAKGICQLCGEPAPFNDNNGMPYLEVHHVEWLSRGGADKISNAVALCPNCHSKMHIVDDPADVQYLKRKAREE